MKNNKLEGIRLSEKDKLKAEKTSHRNALISDGTYAIPSHKIHRNKKIYDRKNIGKETNNDD